MRIERFNESTDENVELIKDILIDFLDEFNTRSISVERTTKNDGFANNAAISQLILKMEKRILSPAAIRVAMESNYSHRYLFHGSDKDTEVYLRNVNMIKKYSKWKSIIAMIRFDDTVCDRLEIVNKIESCLEIIESYGFVTITFEKYGINSTMTLLEFYHE